MLLYERLRSMEKVRHFGKEQSERTQGEREKRLLIGILHQSSLEPITRF